MIRVAAKSRFFYVARLASIRYVSGTTENATFHSPSPPLKERNRPSQQYQPQRRSSKNETTPEEPVGSSASFSNKLRPLQPHGSSFIREDVPWLSLHKLRSIPYMDEAEAKYGRKETWYLYEDVELRRTLLALLARYFTELCGAVTEAQKQERNLNRKVAAGAEEIASWLHTVSQNPDQFDQWLSLYKTEEKDSAPDATSEMSSEANVKKNAPSTTADSVSRDEMTKPAPRLATGGFGGSNVAPYEELPFLRKRLDEDPDSLDQELADWVRANPGASSAQEEADSEESQSSVLETVMNSITGEVQPDNRKRKSPSSASQLNTTLKEKLQSIQQTYDAEGVYFERLPIDSGEKKPKMVKSGSLRIPKEGVVKIDWPTVRAAYGRNVMPEVSFRARERILRLCRSEDPQTI